MADASSSADEEPTQPPTLLAMTRGFVVLSVVSVGGGTAAWARELYVLRYRWMTDDEFLQARALAQILPGPNMLNFSVYVGSHFHGPLGGLAALLALCAIPFFLVMALGMLYFHGHEIPSERAVLHALAAAAAGASFGTAFNSGKKHFKEPVFVVLALFVFITVGLLHWSMIAVAIGVTLVALYVYRPRGEA